MWTPSRPAAWVTDLFWIGVLVAGFSLLLFAQGDPAHPFPNHEEPAAGWFCTPAQNDHDRQTNAHACDCRGMGKEPMCPDGDASYEQRSKCKVFCHEDHCTCERMCQDS